MFVRNGQKLGSILVDDTGVEAERPTSSESPKKKAPAKKAAAFKKAEPEPSVEDDEGRDEKGDEG